MNRTTHTTDNNLVLKVTTTLLHDHIVTAAQMLRLGQLPSVRYELASALETLSNLEAITPITPSTPITPIIP